MRLSQGFALVCVLALLGCDDPNVIEYRGSAMTEAAPDSAATLAITFWSRTDSSFGGFVKAGSPISQGGFAYAWHERGMLRIVTVSPSGDTLVWRSRTSDDSIGGTFETTGGAQKDLGGTWRAHRVKGHTASAATLRLPTRSDWLAPALMVWPALLLAAILAARWIRRKPIPPGPPVDRGIAAVGRTAGIGGWLAFFSLGQAFGTAFYIVRSFPAVVASATGPTWTIGAASPALRPTLLLEMAFSLLHIVLPAVGLYLIFRRNRYAPRFWFALMMAFGVYAALDIAGGWALHSQLLDRLGPEFASSNSSSSARWSNISMLIASWLWALYWARSIRVRSTFGADAIDRRIATTTTAPPAPAEVIAPPSPEVLVES